MSQTPSQKPPAAPLVSVVMANYQAGYRIERALQSVLAQTMTDLEVIVADDASGDDSVVRVIEAMRRDNRIRLIQVEHNGGPARSRNRALAAARGQWIAIVDSDDIIHPERLERLLAAATHFNADIVADDLLHFHEDGAPSSFLLRENQQSPFKVTAEDWVLAGFRPGTAPLGYIKPLIRAEILRDLRYDESLRIGEDFDLLLRALLDGASLQIIPEPWYLYRRHRASISHRLSVADVGAMIDNQQKLVSRHGPFEPPLQAAFDERLAALRHSHDYEQLVAAIKQRNPARTLQQLASNPGLLRPLWRSLSERRKAGAVTTRNTAPLALRLGNTVSGNDIATQAKRLVPPYIAPREIQWDRPPSRLLWSELADLGNGRELQVHCDDPAGRYAAGFIPAQRLQLIEATPPASSRPLAGASTK